MVEKMHLFELVSPIFHGVKVKEVKDVNIGIIYISILLSFLSPPPPCAPRFGSFSMRICARGGERGKEVPIDAPTPLRRRSRHVGAGSTIAPKAAQPYGPPRRAATSRNVKGGKMGNPIGTPPASVASVRGGNGQEQKQIRSVVKNQSPRDATCQET